MADLLQTIFFSALDIARGSLFVAIPLIVLVVIGSVVRKKIEEETKLNWVATAFLATLFLCWILVAIAYFFPILESLQEQGIGVIPSPFAPTPTDILASIALGFVKVTISSVVISLILMPFELAGTFIRDAVSRRVKSGALSLVLTVYLSALFASVVFLFLVPQAITGLFYLIYFG